MWLLTYKLYKYQKIFQKTLENSKIPREPYCKDKREFRAHRVFSRDHEKSRYEDWGSFENKR